MAEASRTKRVRPLVLAPAAVVVALTHVACGSTARLEELTSQLVAIEQQLQQLQDQVASKAEAAELERLVRDQADRVIAAESETEAEIGLLGDDIERLGRKVDRTQTSLTELAEAVAGAKGELESLRTQVAEIGNEEAPLPPALSSDPDELYRASYSDFEAGNYDLALIGFRHFVDSFANSEQADDALYWIGECYLSQRKYGQAIQEFGQVARLYPNSNRLASAVLRKGLAYLASGNADDGREALEEVVASFPQSDEAILAREQLESLIGSR